MIMRMKSRLFAISLFLVAAATLNTAWARHLTLHQAIAKVERETHGKVLSAEIKHHGRRIIYRIKVLTRDGEVRVVEVPADSSRKNGHRDANR